jgi:hypothetical protein
MFLDLTRRTFQVFREAILSSHLISKTSSKFMHLRQPGRMLRRPSSRKLATSQVPFRVPSMIPVQLMRATVVDVKFSCVAVSNPDVGCQAMAVRSAFL